MEQQWEIQGTDSNSENNKEHTEEIENQEKKNEKEESSVNNVGLDLGYGLVKYLDGEEAYSFPSVVGQGSELQYQSDLIADIDPLSNLHIQIGKELFFVGDLAIRQSEIASRSLDQDRSKDRNSKVLMLTALSLLCKKDKQNFNIVTGLPTNYFAAYKDDWKNSLVAEYNTSLFKDGKVHECSFSITDARIVPQPFGTLFDKTLNSAGEIIDEEIPKEIVGIIDIGYKTTDLAVANRTEFIDKLSFSTTTALSSAYNIVGDRLRREYKVDKEEYQLEECIKNKTVKIAGEKHDISSVVDSAFKMVAGKIATEIESKWDYKQFDRILLTGGGGKVLSQYITSSFPNMELVEEPLIANVKGYQKLARKIFS